MRFEFQSSHVIENHNKMYLGMRGGALQNFLEHEMFVSPLGCAWDFLVGKGHAWIFPTQHLLDFFLHCSPHMMCAGIFFPKFLNLIPFPSKKKIMVCLLPRIVQCTFTSAWFNNNILSQKQNQGSIYSTFSHQIKQVRCIMKNDYTTSFRTWSKCHNSKKMWRKSTTFYVDI